MDLGFGPEEGASGVIVAFNESVDVGHEFFDAGEGVNWTPFVGPREVGFKV